MEGSEGSEARVRSSDLGDWPVVGDAQNMDYCRTTAPVMHTCTSARTLQLRGTWRCWRARGMRGGQRQLTAAGSPLQLASRITHAVPLGLPPISITGIFSGGTEDLELQDSSLITNLQAFESVTEQHSTALRTQPGRNGVQAGVRVMSVSLWRNCIQTQVGGGSVRVGRVRERTCMGWRPRSKWTCLCRSE